MSWEGDCQGCEACDIMTQQMGLRFDDRFDGPGIHLRPGGEGKVFLLASAS
jgi:hypothetical protein